MMRPLLGFDVHFFTNLKMQKYMDQENNYYYLEGILVVWCGVFYEKKSLHWISFLNCLKYTNFCHLVLNMFFVITYSDLCFWKILESKNL